MTFCFLHERQELSGQTAALMHTKFGKPENRACYDELIAHSLTAGKLPMAILAVEDGAVVGTVGVWRADLFCRQDLCPWLGCLMVREPYRNSGIAGELLRRAVHCCASLGFESVYGDGKFGSEDLITREQLATILYRYAQYKKIDVSVGEDTSLLSFEDAETISGYAYPAMQWVCGAGILKGTDNRLNPIQSATREQVAAILHRYCEVYIR